MILSDFGVHFFHPTSLFLSFAAGLVFVVAAVALFSDFRIDSSRGLLGAAYIGAFEMGITFVTWSRALALAKTTAHVSHLIYIIPFLSLVFIHFVLDEKVLASTIVGLVLVIGGILMRGLDRSSDTR